MPYPTKRTPEHRKAILALLESGNTRMTASVAAGVSYDVFRRWAKDEPEFLEDVERAEQRAVANNVAIILNAAKRSWPAAAWWLERRHREDYGNVVKLEATYGKLSDDELLARAKSLFGGTGKEGDASGPPNADS